MGLMLLLDLKVGKDGWNCKIVQYSRKSSVQNGIKIFMFVFLSMYGGRI
jgi:hypothetical protein